MSIYVWPYSAYTVNVACNDTVKQTKFNQGNELVYMWTGQIQAEEHSGASLTLLKTRTCEKHESMVCVVLCDRIYLGLL